MAENAWVVGSVIVTFTFLLYLFGVDAYTTKLLLGQKVGNKKWLELAWLGSFALYFFAMLFLMATGKVIQ